MLILDDVFAELDADRRVRLAEVARGYEQVVVTAAVDQDVPPPLRTQVVRVDAGRILPEEEPHDG